MAEDVTTVSRADDIRTAHRDISGRDTEAIRAALDDPDAPEYVVWLPEWLVEEKDLRYLHGRVQAAAGALEAETDKAWCIGQPHREDGVWVPKSQAVLFTRAGGLSEIKSEQRTLG